MAAATELLDLFVQEAVEMVRELEQGVILLERSPRDPALVNRVFRAVHTLKGNADIVGLEALAALSHAMETLLDGVRKGRLATNEGVFTTLLSGVDLIRSIIEDVGASNSVDRAQEVHRIRMQLEAHAKPLKQDAWQLPPASSSPAVTVLSIHMSFAHDALESGHDPVLLLDELTRIGTVESITSCIDALPGLRQMDVRSSYLEWDLRFKCEGGRKAVESLFSFLPGGNRIDIKQLSEAVMPPGPPQAGAFWEPEAGAQLAVSQRWPAGFGMSPPTPEPSVAMPRTEHNLAAPSYEASTEESFAVDTAARVPAAFSAAASVSPQCAPTSVQQPAVSHGNHLHPSHAEGELLRRPPLPPPTGRPAEVASSPHASNEGGSRSDTIRVNVKVLDRLMGLAGEMVLTRNQLVQSIRNGDLGRVERAAQRVDLVTTELQEAVMATRMQSVRVVFDKFQRSVRELAHELGKQVRLVIEDEGVELDRTVIEAIGDPLSHLVRNAVGHGIETPEERIARGKHPEGTIKLRAWHGAGQVIVDVIDDGRGIDVDKVKARAIALGMLTPDEAAVLTPKAIRELICKPGFTTADTVTQVSGRGVGLDVVHANLAAIGGKVHLESEPGQGCAFRVRLPLTLAILPALLVEVEGERFAIPQINLVELVRVLPADVAKRIERVGGVDVIRVRQQLVPLVRLRDILGISNPTYAVEPAGERLPDRRHALGDRRSLDGGQSARPADGEGLDRRGSSDRRVSPASAINIAVVSSGDLTYGLVVDRMLDSLEIVVKPLGRSLSACQCYSGATVPGDGRAALILNVMGLARMANMAHRASVAALKEQHASSVATVDKVPILLTVGGGGELFGVPLDMVERIRKVPKAQLSMVGGKLFMRGTKTTTPLLSADQFFPAQPLPECDVFHVIVFQTGRQEYGFMAADVKDIVSINADFDVKTHRQRGVCGSTVLDDAVVQILDLREMVGGTIAPPEATLPSAGSGSGSRKRLLVVEDSTFFLNHVAALLEEAGYETDKAANGAVGLEKLTQSPGRFDLVVTDIEMPEMDGFEMVTRMRKNPALSKVPVVAVTSLLGAESRQRGRDAGIDEYCVKLDREDLLSRVALMLQRGRSE